MKAHEASQTHDCKFPNCPNEARSAVGRYAYCDDHRDRSARGLPESNGKPLATRAVTLAASIAALAREAKAVDVARAKAAKLTEKALAAKRHADKLESEFQEKLAAATASAGQAV